MYLLAERQVRPRPGPLRQVRRPLQLLASAVTARLHRMATHQHLPPATADRQRQVQICQSKRHRCRIREWSRSKNAEFTSHRCLRVDRWKSRAMGNRLNLSRMPTATTSSSTSLRTRSRRRDHRRRASQVRHTTYSSIATARRSATAVACGSSHDLLGIFHYFCTFDYVKKLHRICINIHIWSWIACVGSVMAFGTGYFESEERRCFAHWLSDCLAPRRKSKRSFGYFGTESLI